MGARGTTNEAPELHLAKARCSFQETEFWKNSPGLWPRACQIIDITSHQPIKPSIHQELQLGTYGYGVREEFGRCDGLFLLFYNKDTSDMKEIEVDIDFIDGSYNFWTRVKDLHRDGLPQFQEGESPVMPWECKYCQYEKTCNERR